MLTRMAPTFAVASWKTTHSPVECTRPRGLGRATSAETSDAVDRGRRVFRSLRPLTFGESVPAGDQGREALPRPARDWRGSVGRPGAHAAVQLPLRPAPEPARQRHWPLLLGRLRSERRGRPQAQLGQPLLDVRGRAVGAEELLVREEVGRPNARAAADQGVEPDRRLLLDVCQPLIRAEVLVLDAGLVVLTGAVRALDHAAGLDRGQRAVPSLEDDSVPRDEEVVARVDPAAAEMAVL